MVYKPCESCGHEEEDHKFRKATVEQLINEYVKMGSLIPQYRPDSLGITHFMTTDNKICTYEVIFEAMSEMRDSHSECQSSKMFYMCMCKRFKLDNLKFLENEYERKASKTIY